MDVLNIHYTEYEAKFGQTMDSILDFLKLEKSMKDDKEIPFFHHGKSYRDYYTSDQIISISKLVRYLALNETLSLIDEYLV